MFVLAKKMVYVICNVFLFWISAVDHAYFRQFLQNVLKAAEFDLLSTWHLEGNQAVGGEGQTKWSIGCYVFQKTVLSLSHTRPWQIPGRLGVVCGSCPP